MFSCVGGEEHHPRQRRRRVRQPRDQPLVWVSQYLTFIKPVLWIRNDLFLIQIQLLIFRAPDPDPTQFI